MTTTQPVGAWTLADLEGYTLLIAEDGEYEEIDCRDPRAAESIAYLAKRHEQPLNRIIRRLFLGVILRAGDRTWSAAWGHFGNSCCFI